MVQKKKLGRRARAAKQCEQVMKELRKGVANLKSQRRALTKLIKRKLARKPEVANYDCE